MESNVLQGIPTLRFGAKLQNLPYTKVVKQKSFCNEGRLIIFVLL